MARFARQDFPFFVRNIVPLTPLFLILAPCPYSNGETDKRVLFSLGHDRLIDSYPYVEKISRLRRSFFAPFFLFTSPHYDICLDFGPPPNPCWPPSNKYPGYATGSS